MGRRTKYKRIRKYLAKQDVKSRSQETSGVRQGRLSQMRDYMLSRLSQESPTAIAVSYTHLDVYKRQVHTLKLW